MFVPHLISDKEGVGGDNFRKKLILVEYDQLMSFLKTENLDSWNWSSQKNRFLKLKKVNPFRGLSIFEIECVQTGP
jgi:hypothetical protein